VGFLTRGRAVATIEEGLALATQQHQQGNLAYAEQVYRAILAADPRQADALHYLGVIAYQQGRHREAIDLIGRALAADPSVAACHSNIGLAYQAAGDMTRATAHYQEALRLQPDYA